MTSSRGSTRLKQFRHWAMLPFLVIVLVLAVDMFIKGARGATHSYFFGALMLAFAIWPIVLIVRGERSRIANTSPNRPS